MTATEELVNRLKRGEVLCTWDVNHTALAPALAMDLVIVTDDCRLKLFPASEFPDFDRQELHQDRREGRQDARRDR